MNTRETLEDLPVPEKEKNPKEKETPRRKSSHNKIQKKEILNNRWNNPWNPYYFNSYLLTRCAL